MSDPALDADDVEELLGLAVTALGGSARQGQARMARAVAEAVSCGEHLMVQAGTGTGKSLAYLVPLAAHAASGGAPVVVSTATLALQRQVAERDVPLLSQALAPVLGRELDVEVVKGRSHYVCVNKLAGGMDEGEQVLFDAGDDGAGAGAGSSRLARQVQRVRRWARETPTGDRDDLVPGVAERAWRQVSVTARECLGAARCPVAEQCHVELGRARARTADVVVTNHALLVIDALEGRALLPEHDVVVVDEAHELTARATSSASAVLSSVTVGAAAAAGARQGADVEALERAGDDLAAALEAAAEGRLPRGLPRELVAPLAAVRDGARAALSALERAEGGSRPATARGGLTEVFEVAERVLAAREDAGQVLWLERADRATGAGLHLAPLSVAQVLRERLFATRTVVMTSATLAPGGDFAAAASAVGLDLAAAGSDPAAGGPRPPGTPDPSRARALDVGSPFDYPRQGMLYVAAHLPPPGRDGTAPAATDELVDLVTAAGGRTLALFSSRRAAEAAAEAVRLRVEHPVLCQGDDTVAALVRGFVADPATCLFGTLGLWQGVDAPGPTCQLVVLDRIPFPRPDEPLSAARTQALARSGGNGFMGVAAAHAALLLAQGSGRLIRSTTDRGVVAVLDPRLATARYGPFLRAAMPPLWPTTDRAVALGALERLDAAARRG